MEFSQREFGYAYFINHIVQHKNISFLKWDNFFIRKNVINSKEDLKKKLICFAPKSVSIGACYETISRHRFSGKEYTFDLDLTDYTYKACCEKQRICHRCIIILTTAARILENELQISFGVKTMFWGKFIKRSICLLFNSKSFQWQERTSLLDS